MPRLWWLAACCALAVLLATSPARSGPWVEFNTDGNLVVRAIATPGTICPAATANGALLAMRPRGEADSRFPITLCQAEIPANATRVTVGGAAVPRVAATVKRVVVIGDTGCRLARWGAQDCSDPAAWPFATVARLAAAKHPDLVIDVGDYLYREAPCPPLNRGCAGSPHGDNWPAWKADFFDPAAPLLAAAPWVMVRGNHETCERGGPGWFRLLDPHPAARECAPQTAPYRLQAGGLALLAFDSSAADDAQADRKALPIYRAQLAELLSHAPPHAWLLTHRPFWALNQGYGAVLTPMVNATLQAASRGLIPPQLDMIVSGHVHDFMSYDFGPGRPAQLVVGDGGDLSDKVIQPPRPGTVIDGMPIRKGFALQRFGYFLLDRTELGWDGTLYGTDDKVLAHCTLRGRAVECR